MVKLLYFSWLRVKIGVAEESLHPPEAVTTVGDMITWLATQSAGHAAALSQPEAIKAAVNQVYAEFDQPIQKGDEIALFPPVTGG